MKILITGTNGFLGRAIVQAYENQTEHMVISLTGTSQVDLLDFQSVKQVFIACKPDVVIHCAAKVGGILANKSSPGTFIYENLQMGLNLIEISRLTRVSKFINIGTICSYPANPKTVPFIESELWDGYPTEITAPYGIAKKALNEVLVAYRKQYGFNGITLMPTNIYGPGDHFGNENVHVVAALIEKIDRLSDGDSLELLGDGTATRELIYVDVAVKAIMLCQEKYNDTEPVNIGTQQEISIKDLAELIAKLMNKKISIKFVGNKELNGAQRRCLNTHKLKSLGFSERMPLEEGLVKTIEYYKGIK